MATQGMVVVMDAGGVLVKAVCGCDGYRARALADVVRRRNLRTAQDVFTAAKRVGFGCTNDLVVMDRNTTCTECSDDLPPLYRDTFADPRFNPRWECGLCGNTEIVTTPAAPAAESK